MTTWLPLESNPEVLTKYIHKLGVSPLWSVVDVIGLDDELLEYVPKPTKAVILLCPCPEMFEQYCKDKDAELEANPPTVHDDLFYMKQCIHNACGTIALVHAIANNPSIELDDDSVLKNYLDAAKGLSPKDRGSLLEGDSAFTGEHQELALEGQTEADPSAKVNHHFIAYVNHDGVLYELDGRRFCAIPHGKTSEETLLKDAAQLCKAAIERDPEDMRFSILAVAPTQF